MEGAVDPVGAWLMMAVGDDRQHGGNDGYDDEPAGHYSWDSTVPNAGAPRAGDIIALWDKRTLLGVSIIERVDVEADEKYRYSCPMCGKASLKARKTLTPRFKCFRCSGVFEKPVAVLSEVTTYRSTHDVAWVELAGCVSGSELRSLCVSTGSQLSIRPLRWAALRSAVRLSRNGQDLSFLERRRQALASGHTVTTTRARVGRPAFRSELLRQFGSVCAFSGPAPQVALEACHLYSYAEVGAHHGDGGLLLRRDLHRLLDLGRIVVEPGHLRLDVCPSLGDFPEYQRLHGRQLAVSPPAGVRRWLREHWAAHRPVAV